MAPFPNLWQGPYYGRAGWFARFPPERIPPALGRYGNEIRRVISVLNGVLRDLKWLVGDKCTYADLSSMPWQLGRSAMLPTRRPWMKSFPTRQHGSNAWASVLWLSRHFGIKIRLLRERRKKRLGLKAIDSVEPSKENNGVLFLGFQHVWLERKANSTFDQHLQRRH